jgi:hypothetical protein
MNKDAYTKAFLQAAELPVNEKNIKDYKAVWWWSFRKKNQGGLRLTEQALEFIEEHAKIKTYKIDFPKEFAFTPQVLVWLDNFIESPYFITKKNITVLREKAAADQRAEEELRRALQAEGAKQCPGCHFMISRTTGCNHMTCSRCRVEFCYVCGTTNWRGCGHY